MLREEADFSPGVCACVWGINHVCIDSDSQVTMSEFEYGKITIVEMSMHSLFWSAYIYVCVKTVLRVGLWSVGL